MPVDRVHSTPVSCWGLWRIEEDESSLQYEVPHETAPVMLANPFKRLEFLAGRALIKTLLEGWEFPYQGITKDAYGKPFLTGSSIQISLSHSYPYVAAILHRSKNVGIDLEQPKEKLLRIAPRILAPQELQDAGTDVVKHCVYWCAKETLIKIYGRKDLTLAHNLLVSPFELSQNGHLVGRILANDKETAIPLIYYVSDGFVVVISA